MGAFLDTLRQYQWVRAADGRLGLVNQVGPRKASVQFGADGPVEHLLRSSLHLATVAEVHNERRGIGGLALDPKGKLVEC